MGEDTSIALKTLGAPTLRFEDPTTQGVQILTYCDQTPCKHEAAIFRSEKATGILKSVAWVPRSKDTEASLEGVLSHYKGVSFVKQRLFYNYGHYFETVEQYSSRSRGLVVSYDPDRKWVTQIYRGISNTLPEERVSRGRFPIITILPERDTASSLQ